MVHGGLQSVFFGFYQAAELAVHTVRMLGGLFTGYGGLGQLIEPLTIADEVGRFAHSSLTAYLIILGFLSISVGVLNLLPLPMRGGRHLMYYLWELLSVKPVSFDWVNVLQKVGLVLLVALMVTALFSDGIRLCG